MKGKGDLDCTTTKIDQSSETRNQLKKKATIPGARGRNVSDDRVKGSERPDPARGPAVRHENRQTETCCETVSDLQSRAVPYDSCWTLLTRVGGSADEADVVQP